MALGPLPAVGAVPTLVPLPAAGAQDGHAATGQLPASLLQAMAAEPALEGLAQAAAVGAQVDPGDAAAAPSHARAAAGVPEGHGLPDAMRLDQRALQQLAWRAPDAARLALSWRATLLQAVGVRGESGDGRPRGGGTVAAADPATLSQASFTASAARAAPAVPTALPGWINVYAWGGMQAMLGVFALEVEEPPPPPRRRTRMGALRFALEVPGLGRIHALLHLADGGIALDLGAQSRALMHYVRERLPALAAAFARAELPLARCRLVDLAGLERGGQASAGLPAGIVLAPTLFRAATELWTVLAPPLVPGCSNTGSGLQA
jgi:hypothetical protein